MNEWSLDVLYKGYYDEAFVNDFKKMDTVIPVTYTHLDVYKRQVMYKNRDTYTS